METIVHDHVVITLDDSSTETMGEIESLLKETFPDTSYGPIWSKVNGFVTYGATTSGSKQLFETKLDYEDKINKLKYYLIGEDIDFVHLTYGDRGDGPAYIKDCSGNLK